MSNAGQVGGMRTSGWLLKSASRASSGGSRRKYTPGAEAAKFMVDVGLIVIASFISSFCEVFVDALIEEYEKRDAKGLYAKARQGKIADFTGIDSAYQCLGSPEVHLDTVKQSPDECVEQVCLR